MRIHMASQVLQPAHSEGEYEWRIRTRCQATVPHWPADQYSRLPEMITCADCLSAVIRDMQVQIRALQARLEHLDTQARGAHHEI